MTFDCSLGVPQKWIFLRMQCPASLAPAIFDVFRSKEVHQLNEGEDELKADMTGQTEQGGLTALLARFFPAVLLVEAAVVAGSVVLTRAATMTTSIDSPVQFGTMRGQLQVGGSDDLGFRIKWLSSDQPQFVRRGNEVETLTTDGPPVKRVKRSGSLQLRGDMKPPPLFTLTQLLTSCNLQRLLPHCPQILLERLRLSDCVVHVSNPTPHGDRTLLVRAYTGNHKFDQLLLVQGDLVLRYDDQSEQPVIARNAVVLKIMQAQLLDTRHFPGLARLGQSKANLRSFVYAEADSPLQLSARLKSILDDCNDEEQTPDSCLFPVSNSVIPHGPHILTVSFLQQDDMDNHTRRAHRPS